MAAASEADASFAVAPLLAVVDRVAQVVVDLLCQAVEVLSHRAAAEDVIPFSAEERDLSAVAEAAEAGERPCRQQRGVGRRRA